MYALWDSEYDVATRMANCAKEFQAKAKELQVELTAAKSEEELQRQEVKQLTKVLDKATKELEAIKKVES